MRQAMIPDRWGRIVNLIEERREVTVSQIALALDVSPATVRRDLACIERRGLIRRIRGGAESCQTARTEWTLTESRKINPWEKELIGRAAAELIDAGDTLMIDGGYTAYQVARHIHAANINVVTNSFDVAQTLAFKKDAKIVLIGGELSVVSGTTVGPVAEKQIRQLSAHKAILGAEAISPAAGVSSCSPLTAQTKNAMIQRCGKVIVVADHTKLGAVALYEVAPIRQVTSLVTDHGADEMILDAFRSAKVEVIVTSGQLGDLAANQ